MVDQSKASSAGNPTVKDRIEAIQGKFGEKKLGAPDTPASFAGKRFQRGETTAPDFGKSLMQPPANGSRAKPLSRFTAQADIEPTPKAPPQPVKSAENTAVKTHSSNDMSATDTAIPESMSERQNTSTIDRTGTQSTRSQTAQSPVENTTAAQPQTAISDIQTHEPIAAQSESNLSNAAGASETGATDRPLSQRQAIPENTNQISLDGTQNDQQDDNLLSFKDTSAFKHRNPIMKYTSWVMRGALGGFDGTQPLVNRRFSGGLLKNIWGLLDHKFGPKPADISSESGPYLKHDNTMTVHAHVKLDIKSNSRAPNLSFFKKQWNEKLVGYAIVPQTNDATSANGGANGVRSASTAGTAAPEELPAFNQNDRPVFVHFTGASLAAENRFDDGKYLGSKFNANVLSLSYRGTGFSSGGLSSNRSRVQDGIATLNHLLHDQNIAPERIVLVGYSMGGNIAANVLQAAEAKGLKLGGLLLDRPMEKLSTGGEAMAKLTSRELKIQPDGFSFENKPPSTGRVIGAKIVWFIAKVFGESYSTTRALKAMSKENREEKTPIFGTYDTDPIGKTSKRMLEKHTISKAAMGDNHDATIAASILALENTAEANPESAAADLWEMLQA